MIARVESLVSLVRHRRSRSTCWPSELGRQRGWSVLSAARGGSVAGHGVAQYERAAAFAKEERLALGASTVRSFESFY